ncbi:neo-calmodulin-like isoform X2 [Tubulanus polymorphus]|uniref:neo-calmodulin-like isoform X2 n=1 Tax=Tubulanus polymorphus TaxID=672921 RepID=UPI003DA4A66D
MSHHNDYMCHSIASIASCCVSGRYGPRTKRLSTDVPPKNSSNSKCEGLSQKERKEFKEAFTLFDKDGDGKITTYELASVMHFLGSKPSQEQIEVMIDQVDTDGNGTVEFEEFLRMMSNNPIKTLPKTEDEEMREAFKVFDRDNDGFIDAQELRFTMNNLGQPLSDEDVKAMIKEADIDGDGRINYEEFIKMMRLKQETS